MEAVAAEITGLVCSWMQWPYNVLLGIVAAGVGLRMIQKWAAGAVCRSNTKLDGKTVIITGANTGIGKYTAIDLAGRNARVILACRNEEKGLRAEFDVRRATGNYKVEFHQLDLSSFASIRKFAKEILEEESRVDILINNAGVLFPPDIKTVDGFESHFGVNHLGHFLLTNLLLDRIKQAPEGRILILSSIGHMFSPQLDLNTINNPENFTSYLNYSKSKLANILFTKALAKRLQGTNVTANALHPGSSSTDLFHQTPVIMVRLFTECWYKGCHLMYRL